MRYRGLSSLENKLHLFICFSSKDEAVANGIVEFLEAEDLKCWISTRDVSPGQNYQETIVQALELAKGLVFLFSESSSASGEIKKELSLAGGLNIPVFPVRLSPIQPGGALRYELSTRQWIDLFPDAETAMHRLAETIHSVLEKSRAQSDTAAQGAGVPPTTNTADVAAALAASPSAQKRTRRPRAPIVAPDSEEFEAIRALLARHIGPIAKVLVQKAATEAKTPEAFCEQLAARVSSPSERAAFVQTVRARLASKK